MVKLLNKGKITTDEIETKLKIYKETRKRANLILNAYMACNAPHLVEKRLDSLNLISKGEFVQISGDVEMEMVICPDQNGLAITRAECLSYSGTNTEQCRTCEHFGQTRKLLLPKN